ncbi:hypothetical protein AB0J86_17785 [Micromonospora sp. NPDC049559]|uniref:hypothetical protein n=1 Tax=Micromonospora sp. NPDC049559 TaxID=3155923 RepID=UPI00341CAD94
MTTQQADIVELIGNPRLNSRRAVGSALTTLLGELGAATPVEPLAVLEPELADLDAVAAKWVRKHGEALVAAL